jgi:hypothetical protein
MWNISGFSGFPDGLEIGTRHCPVKSALFACPYSPRGKRLDSSSTFRSMWLRM